MNQIKDVPESYISFTCVRAESRLFSAPTLGVASEPEERQLKLSTYVSKLVYPISDHLGLLELIQSREVI